MYQYKSLVIILLSRVALILLGPMWLEFLHYSNKRRLLVRLNALRQSREETASTLLMGHQQLIQQDQIWWEQLEIRQEGYMVHQYQIVILRGWALVQVTRVQLKVVVYSTLLRHFYVHLGVSVAFVPCLSWLESYFFLYNNCFDPSAISKR